MCGSCVAVRVARKDATKQVRVQCRQGGVGTSFDIGMQELLPTCRARAMLQAARRKVWIRRCVHTSAGATHPLGILGRRIQPREVRLTTSGGGRTLRSTLTTPSLVVWQQAVAAVVVDARVALRHPLELRLVVLPAPRGRRLCLGPAPPRAPVSGDLDGREPAVRAAAGASDGRGIGAVVLQHLAHDPLCGTKEA